MAYNSPICFRDSSVNADGVRMCASWSLRRREPSRLFPLSAHRGTARWTQRTYPPAEQCWSRFSYRWCQRPARSLSLTEPFSRSDRCRNVALQLILSDLGASAATSCDQENVVGTSYSALSVMGSCAATLFSIAEGGVVFLCSSTGITWTVDYCWSHAHE